MIDRSNEVKSDDDMMAAVGIWVLVSLVALIGGIALLYYIRYVCARCSYFLCHLETFDRMRRPCQSPVTHGDQANSLICAEKFRISF